MGEKHYKVRAARCDFRSSEETVFDTMLRITDPLERSWERLEKAETIVLKTNMVMEPDRVKLYQGHRQELVDEPVFRAAIRLLKERTTARIIVADTSYVAPEERPGEDVYFLPLLEELGVEYREASLPPFKYYDANEPGSIFSKYLLSTVFEESDAVVSLSKMKNHAFMGVTLCLKNLFGFPPTPPHGRDRIYFHHLVRLPYVLSDLGRIIQPTLNIIDGMVAQSGREWGGEPRLGNVIVAGDHVIATDACGARLMGHDPEADWPTAPFRRDRNPLLVSAENGCGTVDLDKIDFETDAEPPIAEFDSDQTDPPGTILIWRRTMCEEALYCRDNWKSLSEKYQGEYFFLQKGEVVWHGDDPRSLGSRRYLNVDSEIRSVFLKWADPEEKEGENYGVYEKALRDMRNR